MNARSENGSFQFIHSATYDQLLTRFRLDPQSIADRVSAALDGG
jgi:hypothetical protein